MEIIGAILKHKHENVLTKEMEEYAAKLIVAIAQGRLKELVK
jgi:hypothetical protein